MQIILVRHGKPAKTNDTIRAAQLQDMVQQYNSAELDTSHMPPSQLLELADECKHFVSSDLKRSIQSTLLISDGIDESHAIYREIDFPSIRLPTPKLRASTWVVIFRIVWLLGYSRHCESFRSVKKRAAFAADRLQQAAQQHESVILVGHGLFNRFIAKVLTQRGWHGPKSLGNRYWDYSVFKKQDN